jgi:hypothetical protein
MWTSDDPHDDCSHWFLRKPKFEDFYRDLLLYGNYYETYQRSYIDPANVLRDIRETDEQYKR